MSDLLTTPARRVVLIPNVVGFPSMSMNRYARDLDAALRRVGAPTWSFETLSCTGEEPWMRLLPGVARRRVAGLNGRWRAYPRLAGRVSGDLWHILDHSHANLAFATPPARTIVTCHDVIPLLASLGLLDVPIKPWIRRTFVRRLDAMRRCVRVVTDSAATRDDLVRHAGFDPARLVVVPIGVEPDFAPEPPDGRSRERERAELRARLGLPDAARVVLHVGTRNRYKNTPALFQALARLRRTRDDVWLLRVGAPFFDDEAAMPEALGIADRVVHAGRVSDADLRACYRAADCCAFPSLYEGFGWPPLEAMASGTPVVVSNAGSLPEVVGEAGTIVAPADHDALAAAILALLTDPALHAERVRAGLERARGFSWEGCARRLLAVYDDVLVGSG